VIHEEKNSHPLTEPALEQPDVASSANGDSSTAAVPEQLPVPEPAQPPGSEPEQRSLPQLEQLSVAELEQILYRRKRSLRRGRLQRLKGDGRVVAVPGHPPPAGTPRPVHAVQAPNAVPPLRAAAAALAAPPPPPSAWRRIANRGLLLVEVGAVVGLFAILFMLWSTRSELNDELAEVQSAEVAAIALPTPTATPIIGTVVLPSGHKPPVEGQPPQPGEAGYIPDHLQPVVNAYVPPPVPTPGPEQARRIQIPAIDIDKPIVQGDDWEQLKKGVGQHVGTTNPGQLGNLVLSAHNDIYGEIFRYLDRLQPGDEIIISTERNSYTYIVRAWDIVEPTAIEVMNPTTHASTTLISCYPYQVNTQRIVVYADLVTTRDG
jgi:sortase A